MAGDCSGIRACLRDKSLPIVYGSEKDNLVNWRDAGAPCGDSVGIGAAFEALDRGKVSKGGSEAIAEENLPYF